MSPPGPDRCFGSDYASAACVRQVLTVSLLLPPAGWMEGIRLSDGERGWVPATHVEEITNKNARLRNLRENKRIKHATSKLEMKPP